MGDFNFMKLFICAMNGWNPYSEDIKSIPYSYWLVAFRVHKFKLYEKWSSLYRPQGEFITSIQSPENYDEWKKFMNQKEKNKKEGKPDEVRIGDSYVAKANTFFDPDRGLVNLETEEVLVSAEDMKKRLNIDGIAYSL